jgi:predicted nucleotidyltransferase
LLRIRSVGYAVAVKQQRLAGAERDRYLADITRALVQEFSPARIILFGSFARGDQNRASDLDIVVIGASQLPFCERIGRALETCYAASKRLPVEVLVYTPQEWERMVRGGNSFAVAVLREGRILYDEQSQSDRGAALADTSSV